MPDLVDHPAFQALEAKAALQPLTNGKPVYGGLMTVDPLVVTNQVAPTATAILYVVSGLVALKGRPITGIAFRIGTTAQATGTHLWFMLGDTALNVLRTTADDTTASGGTVADTTRAMDLTTPYVPATTHEVFVGICSVATTIPTTRGFSGSASVGQGLGSSALRLAGQSTTGLTTPASLGATFTAPVTSNIAPLAWLY